MMNKSYVQSKTRPPVVFIPIFPILLSHRKKDIGVSSKRVQFLS